MKVVRSVLLLIAIFATTFAYPATEKVSTSDDASSSTKSDERVSPIEHEIDFVPLEERRPGAPFPPNGVIDVDANAGGFLGNPFYDNNPFPSLFESFNGLMYRMRQQLNQLLGRVPEQAGDSPFPELHIPNVGNIDLGKGNTTSVTKVIDGHKVTINETEYKQEGENGGSYFKVRVIDVHPDSAEPTGKPVDGPIRDTESMEYADISNEIPKVKDNEAFKSTDIETFDEVDAAGTHHVAHTRSNDHWGYTKPLENIEDNSINSELVPPPDLSNDIYVNQLLLDSGAPTNPDAEVFQVLNGQLPPPRKNVALGYLPPHRGDFNTNEPVNDFNKVGIHPTYTNNMPFMPRPMFPVHQAIPNMPPNNFYLRSPNFPMFQSHLPTNQMYFAQHAPDFPSTANFEYHAPSDDHSATGLRGTKQTNEKEIATSNVPVSTQTGANNPSTTS